MTLLTHKRLIGVVLLSSTLLSGAAAFAAQPTDSQAAVRQSIIGNSYGERSSAAVDVGAANLAAQGHSGDFQESVRLQLSGESTVNAVSVNKASAGQVDATASTSRVVPTTSVDGQSSVRRMLLGEHS
jgi:hypothetical protein